MRKGRDGGETGKTEKKGEGETDENSGHYVIASSRPPERRPLEGRTLAPILILPKYKGILCLSKGGISNHIIGVFFFSEKTLT